MDTDSTLFMNRQATFGNHVSNIQPSFIRQMTADSTVRAPKRCSTTDMNRQAKSGRIMSDIGPNFRRQMTVDSSRARRRNTNDTITLSKARDVLLNVMDHALLQCKTMEEPLSWIYF